MVKCVLQPTEVRKMFQQFGPAVGLRSTPDGNAAGSIPALPAHILKFPELHPASGGRLAPSFSSRAHQSASVTGKQKSAKYVQTI